MYSIRKYICLPKTKAPVIIQVTRATKLFYLLVGSHYITWSAIIVQFDSIANSQSSFDNDSNQIEIRIHGSERLIECSPLYNLKTISLQNIYICSLQ